MDTSDKLQKMASTLLSRSSVTWLLVHKSIQFNACTVCSAAQLCLTTRIIPTTHSQTTSMRTPPLLHHLLYRPPRLYQAGLAHTRRLFIDINGHDDVDRIAQSHKSLSALRLLLERRLRSVSGSWLLAVEEGCVRVRCGGRVAV